MRTSRLTHRLLLGVALLANAGLARADGPPDGFIDLPPAASDGLLYSVDTLSGDLITINPNTAAINPIGPTGFNLVEGLTYHAPSDTLLAIDNDSDQLISINRYTGVGSAVGPVGRDFVFGLTYSEHDGVLYGVDTLNNELLTINPATGVADSLAAHSYDFVGGLTDDPATGVLYAVDYGEDAIFNFLFHEELGVGISAPIVDLAPDSPQGLAFDSTTGDLFAVVPGVGPDRLLRIDPVSDAVSQVGLLASPTLASLEYVPNAVPEPGTLCLLTVLFAAATTRPRSLPRPGRRI